MIAMALANHPDVLIADEPTTALDVTVQARILELLADLKRRIGLSIVFVTHDLGIVRRFADRTYVMRSGEVVESGPTSSAVRRRAPALHQDADQARCARSQGPRPPAMLLSFWTRATSA
jgi:oligopeptide transport system ATP-binding protein